MNAATPKHPIDDLTIADGFRIHELTGQSVEDIRYILRYPRMHSLATVLKVITSHEVSEAINTGVIGELDGESDDEEAEAQETANDIVQVLRDANYQVSRLKDSEAPTPEEIREYALERVEAEIKATNATSYSRVVASLGWVWARKDEPSLTFEEYSELYSEREVIAYLDGMVFEWAKELDSENKEDASQAPLGSEPTNE